MTTLRRTSPVVWALMAVVALATVVPGRLEILATVPMAGLRWSPYIFLGPLVLLLDLLWRRRVGRPHLALVVLASYLVLATTLNVVFGGLPAAPSFMGLMTFLGPACLAVVAAGLGEVEARRVLWVVVATCVLTAAAATASVLGSFALASTVGWSGAIFRAVSPVGGPIATGAVLLLVWPLVLDRAIGGRRPGWSLVAFLLVLTFVLTGSRAIAAVAAVGMVLSLLSTWSGVGFRRRAMTAGVAALLLGFGAISTLQWASALPSGARILQVVVDASDNARLMSLQTGLGLALDRPLIGHAPGTVYPWMTSRDQEVGFTVQMVQTPRGTSLVEPHNTFLMLSVEYGAVFALLLMGVAAVTLLGLAGRSRKTALGAGVPLGVAVFLLQTLGSSHLLIAPRVAILFWTWVGLAFASSPRGNTAPVASPPVSGPPIAAGAP